MGGMKRNGRDFGMSEGPDGPDFSDALYALFDLVHALPPGFGNDTRANQEAVGRAQEVLDQWSQYLPYVPTEQEVLEDEWRAKGDAR